MSANAEKSSAADLARHFDGGAGHDRLRPLRRLKLAPRLAALAGPSPAFNN